MKKMVFLLLPFMMISCKKEAATNENSNDSVIVSEPQAKVFEDSALLKKDSVVKDSPEKIAGEEKKGESVKIIDGQKLPFTIEQEFTDKIQKLIIKIPYYDKPNLNAFITPHNNNMNVRFNQIKTPDGKLDGPFGKEISYKTPQKGEIWLIIGKNLMAEGDLNGVFSVTVE